MSRLAHFLVVSYNSTLKTLKEAQPGKCVQRKYLPTTCSYRTWSRFSRLRLPPLQKLNKFCMKKMYYVTVVVRQESIFISFKPHHFHIIQKKMAI